MPFGPWPGSPGGGGGGFPGYGGAPPAVASASAVGVSLLVARSDHTHALDVVAYNPSAAAMQASGVVQQTYAAPTATPSVLTMTTANIPFGLASGLLTKDAKFLYQTASQRFGVYAGAVGIAAATLPAHISVIDDADSASQSIALNWYAATATSTLVAQHFLRSRGTLAAPATVIAGDQIGATYYRAQTGAATSVRALVLHAETDGTGVIDATHAPTNLVWMGHSGANPSFGVGGDALMGLYYLGDFWVGSAVLANAATAGFLRVPSMAGAPTGVPATVKVFPTAANATVAATAEVIDTTNLRHYAYIGGAWHYTRFDDYTATATRIPFGGATAGTLTDNANMTYTAATQTLTLTGTGGLTEGPLVISTGDIAGRAIHLKTGATTITSDGDLLLAGAGGVLSGIAGSGAISFQISALNDLALGFQNQLLAAAVNGFPFIPSIAGPPTGVPAATYASAAGAKMVAITFDPATNKFWAYNPTAGAWKSIVLI